MIRSLSLPLAACLALAACSTEESKFAVVITVMTDDGQPVPGVGVAVAGQPGKTDAQGKLRLHLVGDEGAKVPVRVSVPKGYRLASGDESQSLLLRRMAGIEAHGTKPLPITHVVKLSPLQRKYAVLVRVGIPNLPVDTFGTQQAVTNNAGVAMFLYDGTPGDELQVRVLTDGRPDLRPQNPSQTYLLAQHTEAYLFKENFAIYHPPQKKVRHQKAGPVIKRL